MEQVDFYFVFTDILEHAGYRYIITGSVASTLYGIPRFTHDLDLVLEFSAHQAREIGQLFPLSSFYCPPLEVLVVEARRPQRGHFNLIHHETGAKADVYIHASNDAMQNWAFENRRRIEMDDTRGLWLAPPEYVIVRKLEYYREGGSQKHLDDIRGMLEISGEALKMDALEYWIKEREVETQWHSARVL